MTEPDDGRTMLRQIETGIHHRYLRVTDRKDSILREMTGPYITEDSADVTDMMESLEDCIAEHSVLGEFRRYMQGLEGMTADDNPSGKLQNYVRRMKHHLVTVVALHGDRFERMRMKHWIEGTGDDGWMTRFMDDHAEAWERIRVESGET